MLEWNIDVYHTNNLTYLINESNRKSMIFTKLHSYMIKSEMPSLYYYSYSTVILIKRNVELRLKQLRSVHFNGRSYTSFEREVN